MYFATLDGREGDRKVELAILLAACFYQGNVNDSLSNFCFLFTLPKGQLSKDTAEHQRTVT